MGHSCKPLGARSAALAVATIIALGLAATVPAAEDVEHGRRLVEHYRLSQPDGDGPFPAVVLVSGCSGFYTHWGKARYDTAQSRLVAAGFLTVRVDYLAVREAWDCQTVPISKVAGDIAWVVANLRSNPRVKVDAINLLGWSWGGASVLWALGADGARAPVTVSAVVAYFPVCGYIDPWDSPVPALVLHGSIDDVAPLSDCESLFKKLPAASRPRLVVLPEARHGFDNAALPERKNYPFGTLGSNPTAAAKAWGELERFLRR